MRTGPGRTEPEVWFRIVHVATNGQNGTRTAIYRDQTVEIALVPEGDYRNGNIGAIIGTFIRRVPADSTW